MVDKDIDKYLNILEGINKVKDGEWNNFRKEGKETILNVTKPEENVVRIEIEYKQ